MFLKFLRKKTVKAEKAEASGVVQGIDREMSYCPSCGDEYRPGIVADCAACRVPLVSGEEQLRRILAKQGSLASRSMDISPEDDLVNIRKGSLHDMKYLRRVLAGERIPSLIGGDESCGRGCCGPELFLQIKRADVDEALKILARDFVRSTALESHDLSNARAVFDQQAAETICPACGCRFSPTLGACPDCGLSFE